MKVGDAIRADLGGGLYVRGIIDSIAHGKIRVKSAGGQIHEANLRGDHTVNGHAPGGLNEARAMLKELDQFKGLSEWEQEFVGDLCEETPRYFSRGQFEMIERIYKRRILGIQ